MSTDKKYLRQLSETCKRSDAYTRLWNIDTRLAREGADDRLRMILLEGIVRYVARNTVPEEKNWETIDALVDLTVPGVSLVNSLTFITATPTGDYGSRSTDDRVPAQEERIEDLLTEGQYEEPEAELLDDEDKEE
ncbi:MAG: hypothetical protein Q8L34_02290 [Candidatus Woesearchaeota archaeon]|nr:hypothetical protein [Candidatus Woesearchaeota archaeon]